MLKYLALLTIITAILFSANAASQDSCAVTITVGGVNTLPCVDHRLDIPIYMDNPCVVGGFSMQILFTEPDWLRFDVNDSLAVDTIGARHTQWGVFNFTVHPYLYLITVTALGDNGMGQGENLPPGDGLLFTIHANFTNRLVSDTCQLINFGTTTVADSTGYILYPKNFVKDSVCVDSCPPSLVRGDANSSGALNGLDVTFLVSYFKGGPSICLGCPCQGDANNSGNVNGLDVIFLVSYFKGGPAPDPPDCPE